MSLRTLRRKSIPIELPDMSEALDYGSAHLIAKGEIVREDRADPKNANRTVAGTRRTDGLRLMCNSGLVSRSQWQAAEDFRRDMELSTGATEKNDSGIRSSGTVEPGQVQLDAIARVRGATKAVGPILNPILNWVVIQGRALEPYYLAQHIGHAKAEKQATDMLDRLADYYSGPCRK